MQGDNLGIFGILWGTAIAFALAAVTMVDSGRKKVLTVLWAIAAIFLIAALLWPWIADAWPQAKAFAQFVGGNQFAIDLVGLAIFSLLVLDYRFRKTPKRYPLDIVGLAQKVDELASRPMVTAYDDNDLRRLINDVMQKQALLEVQLKQALPASEQASNLDRTAFLLSTAAVDTLYRQKLEEALVHVPASPADMPIDTDEKMIRETDRLNKYFQDVGANLSGSRWANDFMSVIRRAEHEADSDLLRMEVPDGLHPARFRLFHAYPV